MRHMRHACLPLWGKAAGRRGVGPYGPVVILSAAKDLFRFFDSGCASASLKGLGAQRTRPSASAMRRRRMTGEGTTPPPLRGTSTPLSVRCADISPRRGESSPCRGGRAWVRVNGRFVKRPYGPVSSLLYSTFLSPNSAVPRVRGRMISAPADRIPHSEFCIVRRRGLW